MTIRVVLQSIEKGSILVDNAERYVSVGRGVVIYVAFLGEVDDAALRQAVTTIMAAKIFQCICPGSSPPYSSTALGECQNADILVVPQASLGGKLKGKSIQYHALANRPQASMLFERFCRLLREARGIHVASVDANGVPLDETEGIGPSQCAGRVVSGTYGNRQGLKIDSEGPLTHFLDL